jgi:hypothetical protein
LISAPSVLVFFLKYSLLAQDSHFDFHSDISIWF